MFYIVIFILFTELTHVYNAVSARESLQETHLIYLGEYANISFTSCLVFKTEARWETPVQTCVGESRRLLFIQIYFELERAAAARAIPSVHRHSPFPTGIAN